MTRERSGDDHDEWVRTRCCAAGAAARSKRVAHDLEQIDAELFGLFKLRSMLHERQMDETLTLSLELRAFAERMDTVDSERQRDYYEGVREKAPMLGRAVPFLNRPL